MSPSEIKLVRKNSGTFSFRTPVTEDGTAVWNLIRSCHPLDENSLYCNLLQCDHFADTCVVAERDDGEILGWISGYLMPDDPSTLFVWQVAVDERAQGNGVAKRMLNALLERDCCDQVDTIKTTITRDNDASWALFRSFARSQGAKLSDEPYFRKEEHFDGEHATEHMVTISLMNAARSAA
ncbi:diaminobutyrate acetyltransferase [Nitratireductor basaltis]|uniref:L-2,4-diaminobutyric acid acetyltransferase n=1 Tax=Nitratireductor basaltis TaxID=472175 RepID=A0A084U7G0_9HYPH|nr:diaminobutyrate acetyltransferase [Nitratireductor basaltis]KFB08896.1 L-2,4-diaminobutyric acid acetyltransferase [Nitratireductor basaltis]